MLKPAKLFFGATLLLAATSAWAQPKLKERYQEYLVCNAGSCFEYHKGSFQISWNGPTITGGLFDNIGAATEFRCRFGDFVIQVPFSWDPNYQPGDTQATIRLTTPPPDTNTVMLIKLDWSKDALRVRIKGFLPDADSPVAQGRAGLDLYPIAVDSEFQLSNSGTTFYSSGFGGFSYPSKAKRTSKVVNGVTYELDKIKVVGPD